MKGGEKGIELSAKIVMLLLAGILVILGGSFIGLGVILAFGIVLIQKILELVFYPTDVIFDRIWSAVALPSSKLKMPPPNGE